jgi:ubiquinone/menaquinone biosynthesis C-methylase UbiE
MRESRTRYVHALGHRWLTPLYDLAAALTTRERTFKDRLIREAGIRPGNRGLSFSLPYADASFDRVLSSLFFHHLSREEKRRTLEEVYRVLRPGGELHVADWGKPARRLVRVMFIAVRMLDGFENTRDSWEGLLPTLLEEAGFERVSLRGEINAPLGTLALHSARKPV